MRKIATYSTPNSPRISHVVSADGVFQPIHSSSLLTIRGEKFRSEHLQIKIGDAKLSPQKWNPLKSNSIYLNYLS